MEKNSGSAGIETGPVHRTGPVLALLGNLQLLLPQPDLPVVRHEHIHHGAVALDATALALVLFVKFFLTSGTSDLDKFRKAAAAAGYTAVDSTEDIRQSWGIGSMLIRSVSVHEDSLRLDYCRLDSADACYRFYAAATLPITGEVTESNTFTGQVYAVDSPTNFAAKIRSGQIMLYVYTTQEDKADVLAFLESVGWWSE